MIPSEMHTYNSFWIKLFIGYNFYDWSVTICFIYCEVLKVKLCLASICLSIHLSVCIVVLLSQKWPNHSFILNLVKYKWNINVVKCNLLSLKLKVIEIKDNIQGEMLCRQCSIFSWPEHKWSGNYCHSVSIVIVVVIVRRQKTLTLLFTHTKLTVAISVWLISVNYIVL